MRMSAPAACPRLQAIVGDAVSTLPPHLAQRLESTLAAREGAGLPPLVQAQIGLHGCADGTAWRETRLTPERCDDMATVSRHLQGAAAVLQVMHAVFELRRQATVTAVFNDAVLPGLLVASRELLEGATQVLHRQKT